MDITVTVVRLALLAFPGLIACQLYRKLRGRRKKEAWESFFEVLIFAVSSYAVWLSIAWSWDRAFPAHQIAGGLNVLAWAIFDRRPPNNWGILFGWLILPASVVGILLACLASLAYFSQAIYFVANKLRITRRGSDEDIWVEFFERKDVPWVVVRDFAHNLTYYGFAKTFSESGRPRELILENVLISLNDGSAPAHVADNVYLCLDGPDFSIEVRPRPLPTGENTHG